MVGDSLSRDTNDENLEGNKRPLLPEYFVSDREITKRQKKADVLILDLTDVPPQPPILKSKAKADRKREHQNMLALLSIKRIRRSRDLFYKLFNETTDILKQCPPDKAVEVERKWKDLIADLHKTTRCGNRYSIN